MSDIPTKKKNPVWICADVWLGIFPFLAPRQLGLQMAFVGNRFDQLVDGHFKTRKWTFGAWTIRGKIGKNGIKQMQIVERVNSLWRELPIPGNDIPLPAKVIGFKRIEINYIDKNVVTFFHRIRRLFSCPITIDLFFWTANWDFISKIILLNIWPLIRGNICTSYHFDGWRRVAPTILNDCPSLKLISSDIVPKFPADDSANASNGQAVAKWLSTPRGDGIPKVLICKNWTKEQMESIKMAFITSSSRVNFFIVFWIIDYEHHFIVPFDLTNELTGECLTLKRHYGHYCNWMMVRCPISRDEKQWAEWEEAAAIGWKWHEQWNKIDLSLDAGAIVGDGLLDDATDTGPSGQQKTTE